MLSFRDGRPIAIVRGGKYDKKLIGILQDGLKPERGNGVPDSPLDQKFWDDPATRDLIKICGIKKKHAAHRICRCVRSAIAPKDSDLIPLYEAALAYQSKRSGRSMEIVEGELEPVPNTDHRECLYIAGPSGSGKSTYVGHYARNFQNIFPESNIFLFSKVRDDEALGGVKGMRVVDLDESLVVDPIEMSELQDSLCIFDDTDTIGDQGIKKAITDLKDAILETGRHHNIYCVITSHLVTNYRETKRVLNECHSITFFPRCGSSQPIKYCCKNYVGMGDKEVSSLFSLPSRWVSIFRHHPQCVMHAKGAYLL
jgi:hypothetical protein